MHRYRLISRPCPSGCRCARDARQWRSASDQQLLVGRQNDDGRAIVDGHGPARRRYPANFAVGNERCFVDLRQWRSDDGVAGSKAQNPLAIRGRAHKTRLCPAHAHLRKFASRRRHDSGSASGGGAGRFRFSRCARACRIAFGFFSKGRLVGGRLRLRRAGIGELRGSGRRCGRIGWRRGAYFVHLRRGWLLRDRGCFTGAGRWRDFGLGGCCFLRRRRFGHAVVDDWRG